MSRLRTGFAAALAVVAATVAPAGADHHADAVALVMTRATGYPGGWSTTCAYDMAWNGAGTLVLAGEPGAYTFQIWGSADGCTSIHDEYGTAWISAPGLVGELRYAKSATAVGIGGWVEVAGHRHRVGAAFVGAAPTSVQPSTTDVWTGTLLLR